MSQGAARVFVCYSHRDRKHVDRLRVHVRPLERSGAIDLWDDTKLIPGTRWRDEIAAAIAHAKAAVLLVSADFLASNFIVENELPPLLAGAKDTGTMILPVIVGACRFSETPALSVFQAVNNPTRPLAVLPVAERERTWLRVANSIEAAFAERDASEGWAVSNGRRLRESLNELVNSPPGSFLVVSSGDYYVQFSLDVNGLDFEAVANNYLSPKYRLNEQAQAALLDRGFAKPKPEVGNFWRFYEAKDLPVRLPEIATLAVQTMSDIYEVGKSTDLDIRLVRGP